ncbi:MAG: glycosyltransferase family 4 protein [Gammaproteobacteria bacterium]|nr:glycosyltransferase family 4 protein [Gammaproteobacteria bacterium]MDH5694328.1 glycosyltransferase family 4 protein [Gammaproteobacteria bacterium]
MHIGFDGKRALHNTRGLGAYSRNLLEALYRYYPDNAYTIFAAPAREPFLKRWQAQFPAFRFVFPQGAFARHVPSLWRSFALAAEAERIGVQIYHGLSQELPRGIEKTRVKSVVTLHDLLFLRQPQFYKTIDRKIYTKKVRHACDVADHIIAISEQTRSDLIRFLKVPANKITVLLQSCDTVFTESHSTEASDLRLRFPTLPERYLFYVGALTESKNLGILIEALAQLEKNEDLHLVFGGKGPDQQRLEQLAKEKRVEWRVHFLGYVETRDLPDLYRGAEMFLYPSFFEGFGIPLIEAQHCSTPVLAARGAALEEAGGEHSLYLDPKDSQAWAQAINELANDEKRRKKMISEGLEFVKKFHPSAVAAQLIEIYESLLHDEEKLKAKTG